MQLALVTRARNSVENEFSITITQLISKFGEKQEGDLVLRICLSAHVQQPRLETGIGMYDIGIYILFFSSHVKIFHSGEFAFVTILKLICIKDLFGCLVLSVWNSCFLVDRNASSFHTPETVDKMLCMSDPGIYRSQGPACFSSETRSYRKLCSVGTIL